MRKNLGPFCVLAAVATAFNLVAVHYSLYPGIHEYHLSIGNFAWSIQQLYYSTGLTIVIYFIRYALTAFMDKKRFILLVASVYPTLTAK